jgi:hypothetical protein
LDTASAAPLRERTIRVSKYFTWRNCDVPGKISMTKVPGAASALAWRPFGCREPGGWPYYWIGSTLGGGMTKNKDVRPWTATEIYKLRGLAKKKVGAEKIAKSLNRSAASTLVKAQALRIPLDARE